eukprot:7355958-Pyramimonas_sp.AAC.1
MECTQSRVRSRCPGLENAGPEFGSARASNCLSGSLPWPLGASLGGLVKACWASFGSCGVSLGSLGAVQAI